MNHDLQFVAVLTSKYDEGLAECRELLRRNGDDTIAYLLELYVGEMNSEDGPTMMRAHFAVLGLIAARVALLTESDDAP